MQTAQPFSKCSRRGSIIVQSDPTTHLGQLAAGAYEVLVLRFRFGCSLRSSRYALSAISWYLRRRPRRICSHPDKETTVWPTHTRCC
jgi:hypothetical protein